MKLIVHIVILSLAAIVILGGIVFVVIDMFTRVEYLKSKISWLGKVLEWRSSLTALLVVATFLLIGDGYELFIKEVPEVPAPPVFIVKAPLPPMIQVRALGPLREPKNSLRRRTMQLANEMEKYLLMRATNPEPPPTATPNSNNPHPSEEEKKAMAQWQQYQRETSDYYFAHYRDRMIGIIKEYDAKGVKTGYLESDARQFPPYIVMPGSAAEGVCMDTLCRFREVAYHIDGGDSLIVITP